MLAHLALLEADDVQIAVDIDRIPVGFDVPPPPQHEPGTRKRVKRTEATMDRRIGIRLAAISCGTLKAISYDHFGSILTEIRKVNFRPKIDLGADFGPSVGIPCINGREALWSVLAAGWRGGYAPKIENGGL